MLVDVPAKSKSPPEPMRRPITSLVFFPSGQKCRLSSRGPARLKRSEKGGSLVMEAKALELLAVRHSGLLTQMPPTIWRDAFEVLLKEMRSARFLLPPVIKHHAASIAQQIVVPIFSPTDAPIARFEPADHSFSVIVGARKLVPVIALDQVGS